MYIQESQMLQYLDRSTWWLDHTRRPSASQMRMSSATRGAMLTDHARSFKHGMGDVRQIC